MGLLVLLLAPTFFALALCILVSNALPSLIVGALMVVLFAFSFILSDKMEAEDIDFSAKIFLYVSLPSGLNAVILLLGWLIYYISK